jgi:hypothetical protein
MLFQCGTGIIHRLQILLSRRSPKTSGVSLVETNIVGEVGLGCVDLERQWPEMFADDLVGMASLPAKS